LESNHQHEFAIHPQEICNRLKARNVVSAARAGYWLFSLSDAGGIAQRISPPRSIEENMYTGTLTGVGDAIVASAVGTLARKMKGKNSISVTAASSLWDLTDSLQFSELADEVHRFVSKVAEVKGATKYSGISDDQKDLKTPVELFTD